jgi:hypothetical protein
MSDPTTDPATTTATPITGVPAAIAAVSAPAVTIGLKEVYDGLQEVKAGVLTFAPTASSVLDHERRLRGVERWVYAIPVALLTAIGSVVAAYSQAH